MLKNYARLTDQAEKIETDMNGRLWIRGVELTRATVNKYKGFELDPDGSLGLDPHKIYRVYRTPEALEAAVSKPESELLPLGNTHDFDTPNAPAKDGRKGAAINPEYRDGVLFADVYVLDKSNIDAISSKKLNAFSVGYDSKLEVKSGTTPDGQEYDLAITDITPNHLKLTDNPRVKTACITDYDFDESQHPRAEDGKFGTKTGSSASGAPESDISTIEIRGDELGEYKNEAGLRAAAAAYYKKNMQGQPINRDGLGEIRFSNKGINESISKSGDSDKLRFLPAVKDIILNGSIGVEESPNHPRTDGIVAFIPVLSKVKLDGVVRDIEVLLGKDRQGHLYYDLFTDNIRTKRPDGGLEKNPRSSSLSNHIVDDLECEVNLFFIAENQPTKKIIDEGILVGKINSCIIKSKQETTITKGLFMKPNFLKLLGKKLKLKDEDIKELEKAANTEVKDADYFSRFEAALKVAFPTKMEDEIAEIMTAISGVIKDIETEDAGVAAVEEGNTSKVAAKAVAGTNDGNKDKELDIESLKKEIKDELKEAEKARQDVSEVVGKSNLGDSAEAIYKAGCKMLGVKIADDATVGEARIAFNTAASFKKSSQPVKIRDDSVKAVSVDEFLKR